MSDKSGPTGLSKNSLLQYTVANQESYGFKNASTLNQTQGKGSAICTLS